MFVFWKLFWSNFAVKWQNILGLVLLSNVYYAI